jgi:uncharacterized protein (TIGR03086 family)
MSRAMCTTADVQKIYSSCSVAFGDRVHAVQGRWDIPTPLPGWTVRRLVNHLVNEERWAPPLLSGSTIDEVGSRFDGDLLGDDPVAAFDDAAAAALSAVRAEGALDGIVHLSFGDHPAREYAMQLAADHLVHAWDLARAIGADETLDTDAVSTVREWFEAMETTYRDMGVIGPRVELPTAAGPQAQLLAMMGRTP